MKHMTRFEMRKKEKILTLFEVIQIFLDEILFDEEIINRAESILKIYFLNLDEIQEIHDIQRALILEIYFEIFDEDQEKILPKNHQNKKILILKKRMKFQFLI